jgi:hypothetical protein
MRCVRERGCHADNIMKRHMGGDSKIQTPFIISKLRCREYAYAQVLNGLAKVILDVFLFINLGSEG